MKQPCRLRCGATVLPVVEVEFAIKALRSPKVRATLVGDRRRIVDLALRVFDEAKQDQVDGRVELNSCHIALVLGAIGVTQAWMHDLLFFRFDEDDEQM